MIKNDDRGAPARFTENDIRPSHLNFDKDAAYARDVERLLRHKEAFVPVACPACGGGEGRPKWTKWTLAYLQCACGTVYISPRPHGFALEESYTKSELYAYWRDKVFPASEAVRREKIVRPRVQRIAGLCRRHGAGSDLLVEVGPGFGTFCEEVLSQQLFRRVLAIEPTPPMAEACRARGSRSSSGRSNTSISTRSPPTRSLPSR